MLSPSAQASHLHKTSKIIVTGLNIVMFMFFGREWEDTDSKPTCSKHSRIQPALPFELHCFDIIKHINKTCRAVQILLLEFLISALGGAERISFTLNLILEDNPPKAVDMRLTRPVPIKLSPRAES